MSIQTSSVIIIVLIIIIIFLFFYKKTESFVLYADTKSTGVKDISETYNYPDCTECITTSNKLKPGFRYNISDDRCVKNNTTGYISNTNLNSLISYSSDPTNELSSCNSDYNSMYSYVGGRYVMLFRNDSTKMRFNHISVHERSISAASLTSNAVIFTTNLVKNVSGQYVYPESVLDSTDSNTIVFESGNSISYTIIKLQNISNIGYVRIRHANVSDAATLNGATLVVLNDPTVVDNINANVVFYKLINTSDINRIIYTNKYLGPLPNYLTSSMSIINKWLLPCDNCGNAAGKLFAGHYYGSGMKCYKPLTNNTNLSIFDTAMSDTSITTNFGSCSSEFDTRYDPPLGKFIQIKRSDSRDIAIQISKIQIYSDYNYNINNLSNISALVKTYKDSSSLFENILDDTESTTLSTTNDRNSFIHIDTGSNTNVIMSGISIKIPIAERYNIVGLKFIIIKIDETNPFDTSKMTVTCERTITSTDVADAKVASGDTLSYTYLIPLTNNKNDSVSTRTDIIINNEVVYDSTNQYLTTYKNGSIYYQIPYTIYTLGNGRKIMAKASADVTNTLEKINISDAVTLFKFSSITNMTSVPGLTDSHLLTPITTRYIQIVPNVSYTLDSTITKIEVYDKTLTVIASFTNPYVIYEVPSTDYNKYLGDSSLSALSNGSVLVDMEVDKKVMFIRIDVNKDYISNLTYAVLNMIDNYGSRVYTYIVTNPKNTNYFITDIDAINESGPFLVNKYLYPDCLTYGLCNTIAPNTYYISEKGKCFKSKSMADLVPCTSTNCMNNLLDYSNTNRIQYVEDNLTSCDTSYDTRIYSLDSPVFWLKMNKPYYVSAGTNNPFNSMRYINAAETPLPYFSANATSGVRVYTVLDNPVKFKQVRFINYCVLNGNSTPGDTTAGARLINLYVTDYDPTTVYGSNVTANELIFSGEIPELTGLYESITGYYYPKTDVKYFPVIERIGKYVILDIVSNWGHASKVGIGSIDFGISSYHVTIPLVLPVTGRYIRINRLDDHSSQIQISEIEVYNASKVKYTITNGSIYPSAPTGYEWNYLVDGNTTTYGSTLGTTNDEYLQVDLGSMTNISYIIIKVRGYPQLTVATEMYKISGCVLNVLDDTLTTLGQYVFQDICDSYKIGYIPCIKWSSLNWNITNPISDPPTMLLKWDTQQVNSVVNTKNLYVYKGDQYVKKWKESKTGNSDNDLTITGLNGNNCRFVVDNDNYPGISITHGINLISNGNRTVYLQGTHFVVGSFTSLTNNFKYLQRVLFTCGGKWNVPNTEGPWYPVSTTWPILQVFPTMSNNTACIGAYYAANKEVQQRSISVSFPDNKKIVYGFKLEHVGGTTFRYALITSLNANTVLYSSTYSGTESQFTGTNTQVGNRYYVNGIQHDLQRWPDVQGYNDPFYGEYYASSNSGILHEINLHDDLTGAQMITECQRLMAKWNCTP